MGAIVTGFLVRAGALGIMAMGFTAIRALAFMALAVLAAIMVLAAGLAPAEAADFTAAAVGHRAGLAGAIPVNA